MALPRKKSRPITVGGVKYRYHVSTSQLDNNGNYSLNLAVSEDGSGKSTLVVKGLTTRDFWLDISDAPLNLNDYAPLRPRHVADTIRRGLAAGWKPEGGPFRLFLTWDDLGGQIL